MPFSNGLSEQQNGSPSRVQLLIEELSDGEFQQLSEYLLKKHRKKDIISEIQPMLALHLLALLDPKTLCKIRRVCKAWKALSTDNVLWKKHCTSSDFLLDIPKSFKHNPSTADYYFQLYKHHILVEQNWDNFNFTRNVFQAHKEAITCISGSEDLLYTGSFDKSIRIWQLPGKKLLSTLDYHSEAVQCLALGKSILVSGSWDKTIIVYSLDNNYSIKHRLRGHLAGIISLAMFPDETLLFSGSVDKIIRIWNLQNGECLHRLGGNGGTVGALLLVPKNPSPTSNDIIDHDKDNSQYYLVSGSNDHSILIWDLYGEDDNDNDTQKQKSSSSSIENISIKEPQVIKKLEGHTRPVTCLTWYKDIVEQQIESFDQETSYSEDSHLVHINTSEFLRSSSASPGGTDISESGDYMDLDDLDLINDNTNDTVDSDGDSNDNEPQTKLNNNDSSIEEIETSSSNKRDSIESSLKDNNVDENTNCINDDSNSSSTVIEKIRIISSSADSTIHIWDFNTGKLIGSAKDHSETVWDLQCNSSRLVSVSSDGFIKMRSLNANNSNQKNFIYNSQINYLNNNNSSNRNVYNHTISNQSYNRKNILFAPSIALVEVDCGIKCLLMTREWLICGTEDGVLIALEFRC